MSANVGGALDRPRWREPFVPRQPGGELATGRELPAQVALPVCGGVGVAALHLLDRARDGNHSRMEARQGGAPTRRAR
jgi:hypothetical protein